MSLPKCPRCDGAVAADAPGALCLRCLLGLGLERLPRAFGRYELLRRIGAGGMGVIFEARESNPNRLVALKMIRSGELASPEEREWFRREAQEASRLEHRNIVTIFYVGEADEPAYYTMRLMTGGTLAERRQRLRHEPRESARLIAAVARAVHHGHARGILHRDLKPANILLDEEGHPHVADFGIASRLDDPDDLERAPGTPHYMSPEQAGPPPRHLTAKSDVYSLGTILYELLTGRPPFDGATNEAVLAQLRTAEPPNLRSLEPRIDRDLEAICLRCLQKDPAGRFSADELADDLERFLRGEPVIGRPLAVGERAGRWARRHPAATGFAATAVLSLLILGVAAVSLEAERRQNTLQANAFAARTLAGLAAFHLARSVQVVEKLAADPLVVARLSAPPGPLPPAIEEIGSQEKFVTLALQNAEGMTVARWPLPPTGEAYFRKWWGWTDQFKEATRRGTQHRAEGYVARPSQSEVTGESKFTISAPVFAADGGLSGVFYASFSTDSVLGHEWVDVGRDSLRTAALLARPDNIESEADQPLPSGFLILVHDQLERGKSLPASSPALAQLPLPDRERPTGILERSTVTDDEYRDPVPGFDRGWLAAFAPVANTGYVVAVQTRASAIEGPPRELLQWAAVLLLGGLAINLIIFIARRTGRGD